MTTKLKPAENLNNKKNKNKNINLRIITLNRTKIVRVDKDNNIIIIVNYALGVSVFRLPAVAEQVPRRANNMSYIYTQ